jgi:hypothetical protein
VSFARANTGFTYIYYTEQLPFLVFPIKKNCHCLFQSGAPSDGFSILWDRLNSIKFLNGLIIKTQCNRYVINFTKKAFENLLKGNTGF